MEADAGALRDLGRVTLYFGAFILAVFAYYLGKGVSKAVGSLHIPFVGGAIEKIVNDAIVNPAKDLMDASQAGIAKGLSGLLDSLAVWIGLVLVLGIGIKDAFSYLWNEALAPRIEAVVKPVRKVADKAATDAKSAAQAAADNLTTAENYARTHAESALADAKDFVRSELRDARKSLQTEANDAAKSAAAAAAAAAKAAEAVAHATVTNVTNVTEQITQEITNVTNKTEQITQQITQEITQQVTQAITQADPELAAALAVVAAELPQIAGDTVADLRNILNSQDLATVAGIFAAVPLIRAMVNTLAVETGLENASCRTKVKGICGTDPAQWSSLLGGLGLVTGIVSLEEIVNLARPLVGVGAAIVSEVA